MLFVRMRLFFVLLLFVLSSCLATPEIHLRIPGTNMEINQPAQLAIGLDVSSKGNQVMVGSGKFVYDLWDLEKGQKLRSFNMGRGSIKVAGSFFAVDVDFFQDGKKALVRSANKTVIVETETGKILKEHMGSFGRMAVSQDKNIGLVTDSSWFKLILIDLKTGEIIRKLEGHADAGLASKAILGVDISSDGKYGISAGLDSTVRLWGLETGKEVRRFTGHTGTFWGGAVYSVKFSSDSRYAISAGGDNTLRLWDVRTGKLIRTFTGHSDSIADVTFSSNGKLALSSCVDATVRLWDVSTGKTLRIFQGHSKGITSGIGSRGVTSVRFTPDDRYALSVGDASLRVWDIASGLEVAMMISFEDGEWLVITAEGYYNSSPKGHKYMRLLRDEKAFSMEQFYDVFYRPDIVTAKLKGKEIKDLVTITMNDAIKNPPPIVEFTSRFTNTDKPRVKVCFQVKSTGGGIGEVRLFHNGKLIQSDGYYKDMAKASSKKMKLAALNSRAIYRDLRGLSIKGRKGVSPVSSKTKGAAFEACREIETISGENEISITAFNRENTVQSYMKTFKFNSSIKPEESRLYILSIGINRYKDKTVNLKYAVKDAKDIEKKLKTQATTLYLFQNIHGALITDRNATKTNIIRKINEYAKVIKPQDSFILFVAGHGVLLQNQYYMITHDYNGTVNDNCMIGSNEIVEISKQIKSLSQLFIFDTCHAGGMDYIISGLYDARMSVLAKKMGLHIYASASDTQAAIDGYKGNGLFSYSLLEGLNNKKTADFNNDGQIGLVELGRFSKQTTTSLSKKIGHSQTPLIINFGKDNPLYRLR